LDSREPRDYSTAFQVASGRRKIRDVYDHLQRLNQTEDSIRDTIGTAIAVIYGMNFEHMPELKWRYGYALSLLAMAGIDLYLYFRFKHSRWL
jgi:magnesium transporter